ncbi:TadE/TadG family type IV pilus assembly protein [Actinomadura sp. HBU206391]|uniref:TadE/TadG family type IV pilus assembly protein n=1 Tax=Actinomadura sp. HBU206391 TaxID=2731692 RepID=UPI00164F4C18|nr:TadE family protein [Actinomadura sp. HBU206391]MBC6461872.1 pilus assembly protein [Actinomadura sp. HBU206391]
MRKRPDAGMVEFTAMLPIVLTTLMLIWETFLLGMSATYAGHAANEGARVAAVGGGQKAIEEEAVRRISGAWAKEENIKVEYPTDKRDPDYGYVRVTIKPPLLFPGVLLPMSVSARSRVVYEGPE